MSLAIRAWQPLLTPHMAHTLAALRQELGGQLDAVIERRHDSVREAQGWVLEASELTSEQLPDSGWRRRVRQLIDDDPSTIHLFGSPFERSRINAALVYALRRRRRVFLVSEPYCPIAVSYLGARPSWRDHAKAALRPLIYSLYGRLLRSRLTGVFAISPAAVRQFEQMGVDRRRTLPFGYFVPSTPLGPRSHSDSMRVAYLGSFIGRKGVDVLLRAVALAGVPDLHLDLFGPGRNGGPLPSGVAFRGPLPFGMVQATLADYDCVVVPSLFDGWAVVVNEAVQAGTPVIASEATGAAAMVATWGCGATFPTGDVQALATVLRTAAADPALRERWRRRAECLRPLLAPAEAGRYMHEGIAAVLDGHPPPRCPWYAA